VVSQRVTELVGSYWYKDKDAIPVEFTIYGINNDVFPFDHFPSYDEVYDLIKIELNMEENK